MLSQLTILCGFVSKILVSTTGNSLASSYICVTDFIIFSSCFLSYALLWRFDLYSSHALITTSIVRYSAQLLSKDSAKQVSFFFILPDKYAKPADETLEIFKPKQVDGESQAHVTSKNFLKLSYP